jgi:hypothetical protein
MAKEDKGKVKMTVIHFETESDNQTLQENIRAIAQTLSRALANPVRGGSIPALPSGNRVDQPPTVFDENDFEDVAIDAEAVGGGRSKAKGSGSKKPATPHTVDLNFSAAKTSLKDFMDQKKPSSINKRYLAIAFWLRENLGLETVTMHEIYTCYRLMGWNVPRDANQPLRDIKKQGWMNKAQAPGAYSVNHVGENEVNNMG